MSGVYTTDNSWMEEVDFSDEEQRCKALDARDAESFNGMLGIRFAEQSPDRTVAELDIHPRLFQPFGFLHGGVTLALVEAAASRAVDMRADYEKERLLAFILKSITRSRAGKGCCVRSRHSIIRKRTSRSGISKCATKTTISSLMVFSLPRSSHSSDSLKSKLSAKEISEDA